MKVICIDATRRLTLVKLLEEGEIYTAFQAPEKGFEQQYDILEVPTDIDGTPVAFRKDRFIPLSNIDETELVNEQLEAYA